MQLWFKTAVHSLAPVLVSRFMLKQAGRTSTKVTAGRLANDSTSQHMIKVSEVRTLFNFKTAKALKTITLVKTRYGI
jgi:hypothetical protein